MAIGKRETAELEEALDAQGVGVGHVNDDADVAADPQVRARDLITTVEGQDLRVIRQPIRFDGLSTPVGGPAPAVGADTAAVLTELGVSQNDIDAALRRLDTAAL